MEALFVCLFVCCSRDRYNCRICFLVDNRSQGLLCAHRLASMFDECVDRRHREDDDDNEDEDEDEEEEEEE
jgi:hypothetical protein